jgi:ribosomal protein L12E/L44/L45/RPP1/RPP2
MGTPTKGPELFLYRHDHKRTVPYNLSLAQRSDIKTSLQVKRDGKFVMADDNVKALCEKQDPLMSALWKMNTNMLQKLGNDMGVSMDNRWTKQAMCSYLHGRIQMEDAIARGILPGVPTTSLSPDMQNLAALEEKARQQAEEAARREEERRKAESVAAPDAPAPNIESVLAKAREISDAPVDLPPLPTESPEGQKPVKVKRAYKKRVPRKKRTDTTGA